LNSITGALNSNNTHVSNYRDCHCNDTGEILYIDSDIGGLLLYGNFTGILKCQLHDLRWASTQSPWRVTR